MGKGAGSHISVALFLLKECKKYQPVAPYSCIFRHEMLELLEGHQVFNICGYQPLSQYSEAVKELCQKIFFCTHQYIETKLVNDCLTFNIMYFSGCDLCVSVK